MVSVQYFHQNAPRRVPSVQSSARNDVYDNHHQLRPSIAIDGIDLVEQYFEFEVDSDIESVLTDSTYSDDSSYCSINFDNDSNSHIDYCLELPNMPLTTRQNCILPLYDEPTRVNGNSHRNDNADELATLISYNSFVDARKRDIIGRSKDRRSTHLGQSPNQRTSHHNDSADELASLISYDSFVDARKRGIIRRSKDRRSTQRKSTSFTPKSGRLFDLDSDEETVNDIALK